jgi:pimeloyl-ACP methyl ester carboxylesterase
MVLATSLVVGVGTASGQSESGPSAPQPTIVLVHGAWADASSWSEVTSSLQHRGYTVIAPANPLRGLTTDSAYLASVLSTIPGPIVLVGHSYGGMVITNAATGNPNVTALVYIAAFAPDAGETLGGLGAMNPGSQLTPDNLTIRPFDGGADAYISTTAFRSAFAADLSAKDAAVLAASQRPISAQALGEPSGAPAWATGIPTWYLVTTRDNAIPPATQRFMAQRAGAHTVEVRSSHAVTISHPDAVVRIIRDAAEAIS